MYIYIYKQNQNSSTKIKCNRLTQWTKETKNGIHQLSIKLTKEQIGKQNQSKVPTGNKAVKTKLTNMVIKRKERKKKREYKWKVK